MRYLVQVNWDFMVSVDADSPIAAEHMLLDLDGIQTANAFATDAASLSTETFRGAIMGAMTISFEELVLLSNEYAEAWQRVAKAQDRATSAQNTIDDLERQLKDARMVARERQADLAEARRAAQNRNEILHIRADR